jgi:hypothetical protein
MKATYVGSKAFSVVREVMPMHPVEIVNSAGSCVFWDSAGNVDLTDAPGCTSIRLSNESRSKAIPIDRVSPESDAVVL